MNEDFSDIINKFSDILKDKNIDINNISGGNNPPDNNSDFSLDVETILKIKNIISMMNQNQNSARNKLLHSLKPFLKENKKEKLDKYIQIANLLSVMENLDLGLDFLQNKKDYDYIIQTFKLFSFKFS